MIADSYTVSADIGIRRNGAELMRLSAEDTTITMSADAEIKVSLSCSLQDHPDLDLLRDRLCPMQTVNGIQYPMGEFVVATAALVKEPHQRGWQLEAYDLGQTVKQTATQGRLYLAAGSNYIETVQSLLFDSGITRAIVVPSSLTLATEREWEPGTEYLTIINTLLKEINYGSLWFDREGVARVEPVGSSGKTIPYLPDQYSLIYDKVTDSLDVYSAYNVFTVMVSSPDQPPMVATAVNDSPLSAVSTVNRGRRICAPVQQLDSCPNQDELQKYAQQLAFRSMLGCETVEFETIPLPEHWYGDTVVLQEGAFVETGWQITLGYGGSYTHTTKKEVLL